MPIIRLKGELHPELKVLGLKEGDTVEAFTRNTETSGAMYFNRDYNGSTQQCVVYPDNYRILRKCDWCGKHFDYSGYISNGIIKKQFCSDACHRSDFEHFNDNCFSDADPGL